MKVSILIAILLLLAFVTQIQTHKINKHKTPKKSVKSAHKHIGKKTVNHTSTAADSTEDAANLARWKSRISDVQEDSKPGRTGVDGQQDKIAQKRWAHALKDGVEDRTPGTGGDKPEDIRMNKVWYDFLEDGNGKLKKQANNAAKGTVVTSTSSHSAKIHQNTHRRHGKKHAVHQRHTKKHSPQHKNTNKGHKNHHHGKQTQTS